MTAGALLTKVIAGFSLFAAVSVALADDGATGKSEPHAALKNESARSFSYQFSDREIARGARVRGEGVRPGSAVMISIDPALSDQDLDTYGAALDEPGVIRLACDTSSAQPRCVAGGSGRPCAANEDCNFLACSTTGAQTGQCVLGGDGAMCDPNNAGTCATKRCRFSDRKCVLGGSGPLCDQVGERCAAKYCNAQGQCEPHDGKGNWVACNTEDDCNPSTRHYCDPASPGQCIAIPPEEVQSYHVPCRVGHPEDCSRLYCNLGMCLPGFRVWSAKPCTVASDGSSPEPSPECAEERCAAQGTCSLGATGIPCESGVNACGRLYCKGGKCKWRLGSGESLNGCTTFDASCDESGPAPAPTKSTRPGLN